MTIRRLDAFFRTELILDQPQFFNSITNLALAPLQRLVGQNQVESLKGKIHHVHQLTPAAPSGYVATLFKVVVFVCDFFVALVLTPIGIAARHMSFRSPQIHRAYSLAFLLSLDPFEQKPELMEPAFAFMQKMTEAERNEFIGALPEDLALSYLSLPAYRSSAYAFLSQCPLSVQTDILRKLSPSAQGPYLDLDANAEFSEGYLREITAPEHSQLMPHLSIKLIEIYQAQQVEKTKKHSLDKYLTTAIQSLEKLDTGLKSKGPQDPWVAQFRNEPMYPFPFYLVQALENNPTIVARADTALWERFQSLRQSCLEFLPPDCDDVLLQTTKDQANKTVSATFKANVSFLNALKKNLEGTMETSELKKWIERQRCADNYSYPFYTQPSVLKLMSQNATAEKLRPFSESFSACLSLLQEKGLEEYINEKPNLHQVAVNALMKAMDQLENISKLQDLIKTQTA
jgi:hypothetical protein